MQVLYILLVVFAVSFCLLAVIRGNRGTNITNITLESKSSYPIKTCLFACGSFFIIVGFIFFFITIDTIKNWWIVLGVEVGCIINAILFFALGDIAQKVNEIYKKQKD